jgi:hypothetical protein
MLYELYLNNRRGYFGNDYLIRPKLTTAPESEPEEKYQLKSLLNVIANSGVVETYLLTKSEMQYLPDQELKVIYDFITR